jgi:hypothetical protein
LLSYTFLAIHSTRVCSTSGESSRCRRGRGIFIAAQKRPLDRRVIDIK